MRGCSEGFSVRFVGTNIGGKLSTLLGIVALHLLSPLPIALVPGAAHAQSGGSCWVWQSIGFGHSGTGTYETSTALCEAVAAGYSNYSYAGSSYYGPAGPSAPLLSCYYNVISAGVTVTAGEAGDPVQGSGSECTNSYYVLAQGALTQKNCHACVGDPINPTLGNVYTTETDVEFAGSGTVSYKRYYNSADTSGLDLAVGWRHSYGRSVSVVYATIQGAYPGQSAVVSPEYSTAAAACTSGFGQIQGAVPAWSGASASFTNNVCIISNASGTTGTLAIYSALPDPAVTTATEYDVIRDDGQTLRYTVQSGVIVNPPGVSIRLAVTGSGFTVTDDEDNVETYNSAGVLQSITSRSGIVQTIAYDNSGLFLSATDSFGNSITVTRGSGLLSKITVSGGGTVQYGYDGVNRLTTVTNLDGTSRSYQYGDLSLINALTAVIDESSATYSTWGYNGQEQATSSELAGGADATTITYNSNSSVTWTDALGAVRTFSYTRIGDANQVTGISGSQCPTCQEMASTTYDAAGWVASRTDYNGNLTCYANDPVRGLELVRVEGFASGSTCPSNLSTYTPQSGTLQRKITTVWNSTWREPNSITEPSRTTSFTYDGYGNVLTKTVTDTSVSPNVSRTWTYKYFNSGLYGQVQTATGPRTDITTDVTNYTYYNCTSGGDCGHVDTVTNGLSQVTTFNTYNAYGQPLTITDPNGVVTTLTYDARERLTSREVGTETTSYSYWPIGLVKLVTLPDSSTVQFTYNGAHRLTTITDGAGNYISYTLDALGNRTAENWYDPTNTLRRTHTRVFNTLSQLYQDINSAGTAAVTTTLGYDSQGNLTSSDAPLSRNTENQYDALNRLDQITDPGNGVTVLGYDANDNLATLKDPRSLTTTYTHDGFNEVSKLVSPDTGTTTNTYDSAGNLKTVTDARSALGTYTYDALNRLTQAAYADETINYTYDAGTNGKGRLTGASDANHSMSWTYNAQGRIAGKGQTVASVTKSVGYGYTNDDLTSIVTPSGQTIAYTYTNHRITSITVNGTTLLSGVTYDPFGPATAWAWGNSTTVSRSYTEDGVPNQIVTAGVTNAYTEDNALRITGISDSGLSSNSVTFGYDLLDRVTSGTSSVLTHGYTYDANGNRLTETGTLAYTENNSATNNQISTTTGGIARTYSYDSVGNTKSYTGATFTFNDRGRMSTAVTSGGTTSYVYNALGQLIEKSGNGGTTLLVYDEAGHLLGEYSSTGALIEETIWMNDLPVATLRPSGSAIMIYYVHTDQLGTPRKVTNPSGNTVVWRWDPDTYGTAAPSIASISYNLRFPGQYYMPETGLFYNYARDYDPQTGRYVESDPIGLAGGSYSTYSYANSNPISNFDQLGLASSMAQQMFPQPATATGGQACPNSDDKQHCEELLQIDTDTCNAITKRRGRSAGESCHSSATQRYAACLRGKPLPPLNTWNNQVPGPTPNPVPPTVPVIPLPSPVPILPMPPVIEPIPIPIFP